MRQQQRRYKRLLRRLAAAGLSVLSIIILTLLYPPWLVTLLVFVVLVHELGHFYAAKLVGAQPWWPFILFCLILVGVTVVDDMPQWGQTFVTLAGAVVGLIASLFVGIVMTLSGLSAMAVLGAIGFELWSLTLGSDGKRYRRFKRQWSQSSSS